MAADHNDFIFEPGIGSGNFGDGVEAMFVISGELGIDIHLDRHRYVSLEQAVDASVVLNRQHGAGNRTGMLAPVDEPAEGGSSVVEDGSARASVVAPVAAGDQDRDRFLIGKKLTHFLPEFEALQKRLKSIALA